MREPAEAGKIGASSWNQRSIDRPPPSLSWAFPGSATRTSTTRRGSAGRDAPIFRVKRDFVQRRVFKKGARERPHAADFAALDAQVRPLLAAAARRDPRASLAAHHESELLVALVIDTLLDAEKAQPASREAFAWEDLRGALERGLADAGLPAAVFTPGSLL